MKFLDVTEANLDQSIEDVIANTGNYNSICLLANAAKSAFPFACHVSMGWKYLTIDDISYRVSRNGTSLIDLFDQKEYETIRARLPERVTLDSY